MTTALPRITRCAVYTRKSSEEGLDMAFNSLDAQREAGSDYIKSQKHQGWVAIGTAYDDGGFSGGSTDRPGLQKLLADIQAGRVDVVLVYKVDRLSRSLADFARLMQTFDEHHVSFVSVTQQFNTTTSMGRLTLNMLLSFAQFEREVSGERIRDKIAATKRKGLWVCGQPPLGYRVEGTGEKRCLRIVPAEAALVRAIFAGYVEGGSLVGLAAELNAKGHITKQSKSSKGRSRGGRPLDSVYIYRILTNPIYLGQIAHTRGGKTELWPGLHEPILDRALWDRVYGLMAKVERETRHRWTHTHLLKGKIRTFEGHAMSPGSVQKPVLASDPKGAKRHVRYYISQKALKQGYKTCPIKSINASHLDDVVRALVMDHLRTGHRADLRTLDPATRDHWVREVLAAVTLAPDTIKVEVSTERASACAPALRAAAAEEPQGKAPKRPRGAAPVDGSAGGVQTCPFTPEVEEQGERTILTLRLQIKRLDGRRVLLSPEGHDLLTTASLTGQPVARASIIHAIGLAFSWHREMLRDDTTIETIARRHGFGRTYVHNLLRLTNLRPQTLKAALTGTLPAGWGLRELFETSASLDWSRQRKLES